MGLFNPQMFQTSFLYEYKVETFGVNPNTRNCLLQFAGEFIYGLAQCEMVPFRVSPKRAFSGSTSELSRWLSFESPRRIPGPTNLSYHLIRRLHAPNTTPRRGLRNSSPTHPAKSCLHALKRQNPMMTGSDGPARTDDGGAALETLRPEADKGRFGGSLVKPT